MVNVYQDFINQLPNESLGVGQVIAHNTDGTSTLKLTDGSHINLRGTSVAVNAQAFFKGDVIQGVAPDLPVVQITV